MLQRKMPGLENERVGEQIEHDKQNGGWKIM